MSKKGVTYYKLESSYKGDITKYCGLTGPEIDSNFYFLRGNDIESASWDDENQELILTKTDGSKIVVEGIKTPIDAGKSFYDKEKGILFLNINGETTKIEGFKFHRRVHSNDTLVGDGSKLKPLSVSATLIPGYLAPVNSLINMVNGEKLPENPEVGERYLTYESISEQGLLYNFEAVRAINSILFEKESKWHVPSIIEWDEMLNAIEPCEGDKNHVSNKSNANLGKYAGQLLKVMDGSWPEVEDAEGTFEKTYKFNARPSGAANRKGKQYAYGENTEFWSCSMKDESSDVWTKRIDDDKQTVRQQADSNDEMYSLRLVRELGESYQDIELIDGMPYNCTLMPYIDAEGHLGNRVWTIQNVSFTSLLEKNEKFPNAKAIVVKDNDGNIPNVSYKYILNYWNGEAWEKREMPEYSVIVIKNAPLGNTDGYEWILKDGVLVNRQGEMYDALYADVMSAVTEYVDGRIDEVTSAYTQAIQEETERAEAAESAITEALADEVERAEAAESAITEALHEETERAEAAESAITEALNEEIERAEAAESAITEALNEEIERAEAAESAITEALHEETARAEAAESAITEALNDEIERAEAAESALTEALHEETEERIAGEIDNDRKYTISVVDGVTLYTKGGTPIKISFDGDFGLF